MRFFKNLAFAEDQAIEEENDDCANQRHDNAGDVNAAHQVHSKQAGYPTAHKATDHAKEQVNPQTTFGFHDQGSQPTSYQTDDDRCDYTHGISPFLVDYA
jgi:hypothetical protein